MATGTTTDGGKPREVKVVLLGDTGVGKSSLVLRFVTNNYKPYSESTIGASFMSKVVMSNGKQIKFQIWDTAGQEKYHSLARKFPFCSDLFRLLLFVPYFSETFFLLCGKFSCYISRHSLSFSILVPLPSLHFSSLFLICCSPSQPCTIEERRQPSSSMTSPGGRHSRHSRIGWTS